MTTMDFRIRRRVCRAAIVCVAAGLVVQTLGCRSPNGKPSLVQRVRELENEISVLERTLEDRNRKIARQQQQIDTLQQLDPDRPVHLFAPTKIEFASLTGGADLDGQPGDDGVTAYVRPLDRFGDAIKAPGKITVQLLDNSDLTATRSRRVYPR